MFRRRALLAGNVHSAFHQSVLLKLCHRIVGASPVAMTYVDVNSGVFRLFSGVAMLPVTLFLCGRSWLLPTTTTKNKIPPVWCQQNI